MGGLWPSRPTRCLSLGAFTPQLKADISSLHRTVVTAPEIPQRNLVRPSGLSYLLSSRHCGSGFVKARAWVFVNGILESPIPDFPKWVISRHVTSLNRTAHNFSEVSTLESLDPSSPGLSIPRFLISRNGRYYDTWPPSIGQLRSIWDFHNGKSRSLVNMNPDSAIPNFP